VYAPQGQQFAFSRQSGTAGDIRLGTSGVVDGPTNPVTSTAGSAFPAVSWQALNSPQCTAGTPKPAKSGKKITLPTNCPNEDATVTVSGSGKAPKPKLAPALAARKAVKFQIPASTSQVPAGASSVTVSLPKKAAKSIKKATKRGKKAKATLQITFTD